MQADLQLFLNVVEFGMNPQAAVEAARFSSSSFPGSFYPHAYAPGQLNVELGIPTCAGCAGAEGAPPLPSANAASVPSSPCSMRKPGRALLGLTRADRRAFGW